MHCCPETSAGFFFLFKNDLQVVVLTFSYVYCAIPRSFGGVTFSETDGYCPSPLPAHCRLSGPPQCPWCWPLTLPFSLSQRQNEEASAGASLVPKLSSVFTGFPIDVPFLFQNPVQNPTLHLIVMSL